MGKLTHTDSEGKARMVDVSEKKESLRKAILRSTEAAILL